MTRWAVSAVNTALFVVAMIGGSLMGVWATVWLSLRDWYQYAATQLSVALACLLAGALASVWRSRPFQVAVPAALVALLPTMLVYTDAMFRDIRRLGVVDIGSDLLTGATAWPSWLSLAIICAASVVGLRLGRLVFGDGLSRSRHE